MQDQGIAAVKYEWAFSGKNVLTRLHVYNQADQTTLILLWGYKVKSMHIFLTHISGVGKCMKT